MPTPTVQELFDLTGQVAIVTGGARNLGRQMAEALAETGASVVVTARQEAAAVAAAADISASCGVATLGLPLEITEEQSWSTFVERALHAFGRIDILVNNAGGRDAHAVDHESDGPLDVPFLESRPVDEWRHL